ncbi:MAG: response regulator [Candidatus Rokubacteria bacterium]|nr:response regulator [Candidatus Rokubacteria bacterium]
MGKRRILIVDDDAHYADVLKTALEGIGAYEVRTESEPTRAVAAARDFKPDLIVLDIMMPEVDGGEVAAEIGEDEALQHVPLVFLTAAVTQEEVAARGGVIGGRVFMAKSAPLRKLVHFLEEQLGKSDAS